MTREEAVVVLKAFMENPLFSDVHKAAFNIAIHDIKQRHDWDINNLILINKDNYEPLEQEPITKNDLGVDCISRDDVRDVMQELWGTSGELMDRLMALPSVTPQYSSGLEKNSKKLEKDFGESDCISRADARKAIIEYQYSDSFCEEHNIDHSINTSVALLALSDLPSVTPQEPILDKIRAEIEQARQGYEASMDYTDGAREQELSWVLGVIDKYKAESEGKA